MPDPSDIAAQIKVETSFEVTKAQPENNTEENLR